MIAIARIAGLWSVLLRVAKGMRASTRAASAVLGASKLDIGRPATCAWFV